MHLGQAAVAAVPDEPRKRDRRCRVPTAPAMAVHEGKTIPEQVDCLEAGILEDGRAPFRFEEGKP